MKAITIWRPWPVAIFFFKPEIRKDVENRGWVLPQKYIGQRIAIHAGSKCVNVFDEWLRIIKPDPSQTLELLRNWTALSKLHGIIGTVVFTGWHYAEDSKSRWANPGYKCWQIEDPRPLPKPLPCKGAQGFWDIPYEIEKRIIERIGYDR